jgi:hypothetical protein
VIALRRSGGLRLPRLHEVLEIAPDGAFSMWRSVSTATPLPAPIGRFGGRVSDPQLQALTEAAQRAAAEGSRKWRVIPDSPVDRFEVQGAEAILGMRDAGEGAWRELIGLVRPLLDELTSAPLAAIALHLDAGATLVHQGTEPLRLDLSDLAMRANQRREGLSEATWSAPRAVEYGEVVATPEWRLELPFEHGFEVRSGDRVTADVTFAAHDGKELIPVSLHAP